MPTEAEWEYACRAGSTTRFSFGDDLDYSDIENHAWCHENSSDTTHTVGQKEPDAWGLYDMQGNVWEWCSDWHGAYDNASQTDPQGPMTGSSRIIRGGSWFSDPQDCRSASRNSNTPTYPTYADSDVGFRLVRMAP